MTTPFLLLRVALLSSLLLLGTWLAPDLQPAEARPAHPKLREVNKELRTRLHELAKWCVSPKLFGSRYDVYELILSFWPDDDVARKWNGYEQGGKAKKRPSNMSRSGLPALQDWQMKTATWYIEAVEQAMAGSPPAEIAAQRGAAIRLGVTLAPGNEDMRKRNGEMRGKVKGSRTKWILVETDRSRKRRPLLRKLAKASLKGVKKPEKTEPQGLDIHSSTTWKHGYRGEKGRIFGITDATEVRETLVNAEAAMAFVAKALELKPRSISGLTLYSFDTTARGNAFLIGQPDVTQDYLKFVHNLAALWVPKSSRVIIKTPQPDVRLEAGARQVTSALMRAYCGITAKQGWAAEGFALHLVWHITQSRLLNSVRRSEYGEENEAVPDLAKRLKESGTDWMKEGRSLLKSKHCPDLRLILGKTVNTLTAEDILYGYVLAVYLLEGHHKALPDLMKGIAAVKEANYDAVFGAHLGMDVASVEQRLRRWAEETHDLK